MLLDDAQCQLVLVDYQERLIPTIFEHELIVKNARILNQLANMFNVPIIVTEQVPAKLGQTCEPLRNECLENGAKIISKTAFSACAVGLTQALTAAHQPKGNARSIPKHLQKKETPRNTVVLCGMEAHVCLLQTALELLEDEFEVWVVQDASSSRTERNRDAAFDRLAANGVELLTTEMVAFEWARDAQHPEFKQIIELIK